MSVLGYFMILYCIGYSRGEMYDKKWIFQFYKHLNIGGINFFGCSIEDSIKFMRFHSTNSINTGKVLMKCGNGNLSDNYGQFVPKHYPIGAFYDFNCNSSKQFFMKVSEGLMLNMSFVHLISAPDFNSTIAFLEMTNIAFDSNIFLAVDGAIFDLYRIQHGWDIIATYLGTYKPIRLNLDVLNKRYDLNGAKIKSRIVLTNWSFNGSREATERLLDSNFEPQIGLLTRFSYSIHVLLEPLYNFSHDIKVVSGWGIVEEGTGDWTPGSMLADIEAGQAELGVALTRFINRRLDTVLYLPPTWMFRSCFIFKHPSSLASLTALVKPFSFDSWLCTIACVLAGGFFLWLIQRTSSSTSNRNSSSSNGRETLTGHILLALGTICQQGLIKESHRLPMRVVSFFLLTVGLLTYSFYGASVVGFLLMPSPRTINSIDKLIQSPLVKYSEDLLWIKLQIKDNFSENIAKTYEAIKGNSPEEDRYIELVQGLQKVQKGGVALYSEDINLYNVISKTFTRSEICSLAEVQIVTYPSSSIIRKKSPFKELFYRGTSKIRDSGILRRVTKDWTPSRPECLAREDNKAVTWEATFIAYLIYGAGFVLSLLLVYAEVLSKRRTLNRKTFVTGNHHVASRWISATRAMIRIRSYKEMPQDEADSRKQKLTSLPPITE